MFCYVKMIIIQNWNESNGNMIDIPKIFIKLHFLKECPYDLVNLLSFLPLSCYIRGKQLFDFPFV